MEKYEEVRDKAIRNLKIADHMLTQTYPLVKDPKLLLSVLENIFLSLTNSMASLLYYEKMYKNVPPFHDTFESKYNIFKMNLVDRHNIDREYVKFMEEVRNMLLFHKKSPMEFSRKNAFVICSEEYSMKTITQENMKSYLSKAKSFMETINLIIKQSEMRANKDKGIQ